MASRARKKTVLSRAGVSQPRLGDTGSPRLRRSKRAVKPRDLYKAEPATQYLRKESRVLADRHINVVDEVNQVGVQEEEEENYVDELDGVAHEEESVVEANEGADENSNCLGNQQMVNSASDMLGPLNKKEQQALNKKKKREDRLKFLASQIPKEYVGGALRPLRELRAIAEPMVRKGQTFKSRDEAERVIFEANEVNKKLLRSSKRRDGAKGCKNTEKLQLICSAQSCRYKVPVKAMIVEVDGNREVQWQIWAKASSDIVLEHSCTEEHEVRSRIAATNYSNKMLAYTYQGTVNPVSPDLSDVRKVLSDFCALQLSTKRLQRVVDTLYDMGFAERPPKTSL